jgi:hypothetical protein
MRTPEVCRLLTRLGGQANWTTLAAEARKEKMGPTNLKKILDSLVVYGKITREARLGIKRPEVWYVLTEKGLKERIIDTSKPIEENLLILSQMVSAKRLSSTCGKCFADVLLKSKAFVEAVQDFEEEYNRIKKEGILIASSDDAGGEK